MASNPDFNDPSRVYNPQYALLDTLLPGFSLFSSALLRYTKIDISLYLPAIVVLGLLIFAWRYISQWLGEFMDEHLMSTADVRIDDEMYNMLMAWIANQKFAKKSRRFVANTNLNSRMWWLFRDSGDEENEDGGEDDWCIDSISSKLKGGKDKKVQFTPSFGTHYFWYKGWPLIFRRTEDTRQTGYGPISERENISVSSFGRNPTILKELLDECRKSFSKNDDNRTVIYRGGLKPGGGEPTWTRSVSRVSRPFSTVVLDEAVKQSLLDDMTDYLNPLTRRWYSNRGIPYRRGYLLYGPPGTGKSSLSFAIAGHFHLKIYIVSLNSLAMNEENLGTLFAELPKQCVVLLEDIDTAGLTHTRDTKTEDEEKPKTSVPAVPGMNVPTTTPGNGNGGRISLSALLNIIDGVAATEGRILIMTTNHLDKLDEALIRPGRVDITVKFDLASTAMITTIFRGIFATLEGDVPKVIISKKDDLSEVELEKEAAHIENKRLAEEAKIFDLAARFAEIVPPMTFSPAEIQGHLLKHKREPEAAVRDAEAWVTNTKIEKVKQMEKREREREREEKEKLEAEAKEKAEKEKEEKEGKEKEKEKEKKREGKKEKKTKKGKKNKSEVNSVKSSSGSGSDSD